MKPAKKYNRLLQFILEQQLFIGFRMANSDYTDYIMKKKSVQADKETTHLYTKYEHKLGQGKKVLGRSAHVYIIKVQHL